MRLFDHTTRWLVFVGVAIAMSYVLRWLATRGARAGAQRVTDARRALGLAEQPPARDLRAARRGASSTRDADAELAATDPATDASRAGPHDEDGDGSPRGDG